jgi:hypothetical protein
MQVEVKNGIGGELDTFADELHDIVFLRETPWALVRLFEFTVISQFGQVRPQLA